METKKFNCKTEEVPVIAGFVIDELSVDIADFLELSAEYTEEKIEMISTKRTFCLNLGKANVSKKQAQKVTKELEAEKKGLRPVLNKLETYVKKSADALDIAPANFGIKVVRDAINRGNDEGVIGGLKALLGNVNRNLPALQAKGMKAELVDWLTDSCGKIDHLNNEQNRLTNLYSSTADANLKHYNELWDMIKAVCADARAIYKGIDEVKLKKYTISTLRKRVNAEGKRKTENAE